MPWTLPYSSVIRAMCIPVSLKDSRSFRIVIASGAKSGLVTEALISTLPLSTSFARTSFTETIPMTSSRSRSYTGKFDLPLAIIFFRFSSTGSSRSRAIMSERWVISDSTRRSPMSKTPSIMLISALSNTPASVPSSIMILISSSVTGGPIIFLTLNSLRTASVE